MAEKSPTNREILLEIKDMNTRVAVLEDWKKAEDVAKAAVREYRAAEALQRQENRQSKETVLRVSILKQVGIILGIIVAILYAYAAAKGVHP